MNRHRARATQGPRTAGTRDAQDVAQSLQDAAGGQRAIVVTVGVPLCSDGTKINFGSGLYDPFDEKTLLGLPEGLSEPTQADLQFALAVAKHLRSPRATTQPQPIFSLSIFDAKMVHGIGGAEAKRIHAEIAEHPETHLPPEARALYRELRGSLKFDFSLNYRQFGDRFIDRVRGAIRPSVPSVPTPRLARMFQSTGVVLLKQADGAHPTSGMGRILCATPNTMPNKSEHDCAHQLDGRAAVQSGLSAIPLTNEHGSYICEVTAVGRLLAMISRATGPGTAVQGVVTLSILNVCDPGNHKIHRTSWSAGEMVSSLLSHVSGNERLRGLSQTHMTISSDLNSSVATDSQSDTQTRVAFLDRLHSRVRKAASARKAEEIIAGELERIRVKVQDADVNKPPTVLLYGPGDYDVRRVTGKEALRDDAGSSGG